MFKELFTEANKHDFIFQIIDKDSKEVLFITRADNGADQVERKLKQKKFQNRNLKVIRDYKSDRDDVTHLFTESKIKWSEGPDDYESKRKIENLIKSYDYYVHMIDDGKTYNRVMSQNSDILLALDELGVTDFTDQTGHKTEI